MDHHETGHRWLCFRLTHTKPVGDFSDNPSQASSSPLPTLYPLACPTWSNRPLALKSAMPAYRYCKEVVPLKHKLRRMLAKFKAGHSFLRKISPIVPTKPNSKQWLWPDFISGMACNMRCPQKLHPARLPLASWVGRPVKPNPDPILRPQAHRSLLSLGNSSRTRSWRILSYVRCRYCCSLCCLLYDCL